MTEPRGWVGACAAAEAIGMTAAAAAGRFAHDWVDSHAGVAVRLAALAVIVAGLGWAGAAAGPALSADTGSGSPPWALVAPGALALGAAMGAVLGVAQAPALRGAVGRPWRWVGVSAAGWTPAMLIVFAGASLPPASWPIGVVVPLGTLTGAAAGAVLGVVTGWAMPRLDRAAPSSSSAARGAGR